MLAEGYEYEVLATWGLEDELPYELAVEFHVRVVPGTPRATSFTPKTTAELGVAFVHLANLGYAPYSQEINAGNPGCCAEFSFMKIGSL